MIDKEIYKCSRRFSLVGELESIMKGLHLLSQQVKLKFITMRQILNFVSSTLCLLFLMGMMFCSIEVQASQSRVDQVSDRFDPISDIPDLIEAEEVLTVSLTRYKNVRHLEILEQPNLRVTSQQTCTKTVTQLSYAVTCSRQGDLKNKEILRGFEIEYTIRVTDTPTKRIVAATNGGAGYLCI